MLPTSQALLGRTWMNLACGKQALTGFVCGSTYSLRVRSQPDGFWQIVSSQKRRKVCECEGAAGLSAALFLFDDLMPDLIVLTPSSSVSRRLRAEAYRGHGNRIEITTWDRGELVSQVRSTVHLSHRHGV